MPRDDLRDDLRPEVEGEVIPGMYTDFGVARDVPGESTMVRHHPSIDCTGPTGIVQACTGLYKFRVISERASRKVGRAG